MATVTELNYGPPVDVSTLKKRPQIQGVTVGKRVYADGAEPGRKQSFVSRLVAIITMSMMSGAFHMYLAVILFSWVTWVRVLLVLFVASLAIPACKWHTFRYSWIFQTWREYVKLSFITEHVSFTRDRQPPLEFVDVVHVFCLIETSVAPSRERYIYV